MFGNKVTRKILGPEEKRRHPGGLRSKAYINIRLIAGVVGSNCAEGHGCPSLDFCALCSQRPMEEPIALPEGSYRVCARS